MALTRYRIGDLISVIDERNTYGIRRFYGLNIEKEFMPTVANIEGLDASKYKVVRKNRFVFSGMQTGSDVCIRISMYTKDEPIIVSPAYTTFEVTLTEAVLPVYFFMVFLSKEKDRLGWFYSDGSIRSNLDWERFCDIELDFPDLPTQYRSVAVYDAMLRDQQSYERALEELKLVCDGYIEDLRRRMPCEKIGPYISPCNERNTDKSNTFVVGLSTKKEFREALSRVNREELGNYKIVRPDDIAFVPTTDTWKVLAFAQNRFGRPVVVSPIYEVFSVDKSVMIPAYLAMWLSRKEFDRYARFHSWGSARENFSYESMCDVEIPIPDIGIQKAIVGIFSAYTERKRINDRLKAQLKAICPILIRGSLEQTSARPEGMDHVKTAEL